MPLSFNPVLPVPLPAALAAALADEAGTDTTSQASNHAPGARQRVWRDDFGRLTATLSPDDGLILIRYEARTEGERQTQIYLGRDPVPMAQIDPQRAARWETLTFDPAGRLILRAHPGCTEKLVYEGLLLSRLESCGSQQHFGRNAFGLITEHRQDLGGRTYRETYRYGPASQLIERQTASGATLVYHYDEVGRLRRVAKQYTRGWRAWLPGWLPENWRQQPLQSALQWMPLAAQPSGATYGNGAQWQDYYDTAGRLSGGGLQTQAGLLYQTKTLWHQNKPVQETRNGQVQTRLYDPAGRLLPNGLDPKTLEGTHAWLLPASLWQSDVGTQAAPSVTVALNTPTRFYTADGQRTGAWAGMQPTAPVKRNAWGEQSERGEQRLIWDAEGHLSGIEQSGRRLVSYRYDARGVRISKTLHTDAGDKQVFYLYDANRLLSAEADAEGRILREYLYNGTRPYALLEGGRLYAIYSDARGLPRYMLDENQQVVWQGDWDDWGGQSGAKAQAKPVGPTETGLHLALRLAGQYHDAESGLYYNIHRYYDPGQGAYISPDPLGERIGEHRYAYLGHDPLSGTDPQGLFSIPVTTFGGNLTLSKNQVDNGHGDIVNAAFALYHLQKGETLFSRTIINQIILNNYHADGNNDFISGTSAGSANPLNHFDNPNAGYMYDAQGNLNDGYKDGVSDNWIQDALKQINKNRNAYEAPVEKIRGTMHFLTTYNNISDQIGRLGQNLHTLADFYAHTNWVDSAQRGGICKDTKGNILGYVPVGMGRTDLWDEKVTSEIFSGTAHGIGETLWSSKMHTHDYWNKDSDTSTGGREAVDGKSLPGQYYWQAIQYTEAALEEALTIKDENDKIVEVIPSALGETYITESGLPPKSGERIYVRRPITNAYELAVSLAIEHTINEIDHFYQDAGRTAVEDKTLQDILKMDAAELEEHLIKYDVYPDKMGSYR